MVLVAAFGSGHSERACLHEPTPEGAPSHKRGYSRGEQQRHNERAGLTAARIGDDLAPARKQLVLVGFTVFSPQGAGSSEAPLATASTAGSATASTAAANASSVTAEPAGSAAGHAHTAFGADRSDNR